jgi:putative component of membrane protein insertase Oxa1/YidC/SpoIIIJ protein YidD
MKYIALFMIIFIIGWLSLYDNKEELVLNFPTHLEKDVDGFNIKGNFKYKLADKLEEVATLSYTNKYDNKALNYIQEKTGILKEGNLTVKNSYKIVPDKFKIKFILENNISEPFLETVFFKKPLFFEKEISKIDDGTIYFKQPIFYYIGLYFLIFLLFLRETGIGLILLYRKFFSPKKGYKCANGVMTGQSCSDLTLQAFRDKGFIHGMFAYREATKSCKKNASFCKNVDCPEIVCGVCSGAAF